MREMLLATLAFLLFILVHQIHGSDSSECYLDAEEWEQDGKTWTLIDLEEGFNCTLSNKSTNGCKDFRGRGTPFHWNTELENFGITVDRWIIDRNAHLKKKKVVFSVTISNIWFHKLDIRVEDRSDPSVYGRHCQTIEFEQNQLPDKIKVHVMGWNGRRVGIQFLGTGNNANFFREFTMVPPDDTEIGDPITKDQVFGYVDITYSSQVRLFVVPLSADYRVDRYIGELRENINNVFTGIETFNLTEGHYVHDVSVCTIGAAYDFKITPVVNGTLCPDSLIAGFNMSRFPIELFLLILIAVVVPVASFFVLRRLCTWYRNWAWRYVRVHLLIVYSPTHPSHIKVVEQLALYLKNCNIDVTIDMWDIEKRQDRNPSLWCDEAFRKANVVVVVSSPETDYEGMNRPIHTSTAQQVHRLIEENYPRNNKKYVAVLLPYCTRQNIPPEARKFKRVRIPKQCEELLIRCHKTDYTNMFNEWKNNQKLVKSIEIAELDIQKCRCISNPNNRELNEVTYLRPEKVPEDDSDSDGSDDEGFELEGVISDNPIKPKFNTPLKNLNLTASKSESESEDDNQSLGH